MSKSKKEWGKATKEKAQNNYAFWAGHYDVVLEGSKDEPLLVFTQKYDDLQPRNLFGYWYKLDEFENFFKATTVSISRTQPLYSLFMEIMFRDLNSDIVRLAELMGPLFVALPITPDHSVIKEPLAEWHRVAVKLRSILINIMQWQESPSPEELGKDAEQQVNWETYLMRYHPGRRDDIEMGEHNTDLEQMEDLIRPLNIKLLTTQTTANEAYVQELKSEYVHRKEQKHNIAERINSELSELWNWRPKFVQQNHILVNPRRQFDYESGQIITNVPFALHTLLLMLELDLQGKPNRQLKLCTKCQKIVWLKTNTKYIFCSDKCSTVVRQRAFNQRKREDKAKKNPIRLKPKTKTKRRPLSS